jgi:carbonic anhydrase
MKKLVQGVRDFHLRMKSGASAVYEPLAEGQSPDTLFITCADSRVVPAFIATAEPGELFTVRNVGNLIPRSAGDGHSTGDRSEGSAIEYAIQVLNVGDIVVCGHSGCGAMGALLQDRNALPPNLDAWLEHARATLRDDDHSASLGFGDDRADVLSKRNVLLQMQSLMSYSMIRERVQDGRLRLHGWWFDIRSTEVKVHDALQARFIAFEIAFAEVTRG